MSKYHNQDNNCDHEVSLSSYQEARFTCKGGLFSVTFGNDHLKLKYHQPVDRGMVLGGKTLNNHQIIKLDQILGTASVETCGSVSKPEPKYALVVRYYVRRSSGRLLKVKSLCLRSHDQLMANRLSILILKRRDDFLLRNNHQRPKNLLVFVNPYGGRKRARPIYTNTVAPIFDLAGVHCDVIYTQYQNHARSYIESEDLSLYDGVVAVGGDGIVNEIVNGLIYKTQKENRTDLDVSERQLVDGFSYKKLPMRVGIIPAGSTNALVYSMQGSDDPETSAVMIASGARHPLDVCSLHRHDGRFLKFSFAMTSYGFYGNVLRQSEQMRALGPVRYDLAGLKTFVNLRSHQAEISYLPATSYTQNVAEDCTRCRSPCKVCLGGDNHDDDTADSSGYSTSATTPSSSTPSSVSSSNDVSSGYVTSLTPAGSSSLGSGSELNSTTKWKTTQGKFTVVSSSLMTCACRKSPYGLSPSAHLADGNTDLILVKKCSKFDFFRYLSSHIGEGNRFDFPFVQVERVRAIKYKSLTKTSSTTTANEETNGQEESCWNTDGEFIDTSDIYLWVHRSLIDVFSNGIQSSSS